MKRRIKYSCLILSICTFISVSDLRGQTKDELISNSIEYIYHLKFDSAQIGFDRIKSQYPFDPAGYFFDAMITWWKINLNREDVSLDEVFNKKVEKVVEVTDKLLDINDKDQNALFYKGGALGYKGLVSSLRENWFKAAEDGKEALNLLQEAYDIDPMNRDVMFGVGLYNYFAEYVPEVYPVVKPLMLIFPKGDKLKGLSQIKETAESAKFAKTEAKYVLAYLNLIYEKNYAESEKYSRALNEQYPENPLFEKYLANSYVGLGNWPEALNSWLRILSKIDSNKAGYSSRSLNREANYYSALGLVRLGRSAEAEPYIMKAEAITKEMDPQNESAITAFIYLLSGMINDSKGNESTADIYYEKVLAMKNYQNSHDEAERLKSERYGNK